MRTRVEVHGGAEAGAAGVEAQLVFFRVELLLEFGFAGRGAAEGEEDVVGVEEVAGLDDADVAEEGVWGAVGVRELVVEDVGGADEAGGWGGGEVGVVGLVGHVVGVGVRVGVGGGGGSGCIGMILTTCGLGGGMVGLGGGWLGVNTVCGATTATRRVFLERIVRRLLCVSVSLQVKYDRLENQLTVFSKLLSNSSSSESSN